MNETFVTTETTIRSATLFQRINSLAGRDGKDYSDVIQELVGIFSEGYLYLAADFSPGSVSSWWAYLEKPERSKTIWDATVVGQAKFLSDTTCKVLSKIHAGHQWFELYVIEPRPFTPSIYEDFEL